MILSRVKISPQQRYDLEDFIAGQAAARSDSKLWTQKFLAENNMVLGGFTVSGVGLNQATVSMSNAALMIPQSTFDFSYFISAPSDPDIILTDADLVDGVRNYVEAQLTTLDGVPLVKAFWDPEANSGAGAEFNQIVNTITDIRVSFVVSTGGFSGSDDRIPIAIIDTDGSGAIKIILDRRELYGRLAKPNDIDNEYSWGTKQEPVYQLNLTGGSGTYVAGETITIGSETATVVTGGTTSITFNAPSGINFSTGDSVVGGTSGASRTINTVFESFTGVDKNLVGQKNINDALMTEIKLMKGTRFWWQSAPSLVDVQEDRAGYLRSNNKVTWTGTQLEFTSDIILEFLSTATGAISTHTVLVANSPIILADGESAWVAINRAATSENLTLKFSSVDPIPPTSGGASPDVYVLFHRKDAGGFGFCHIPFHKQVLEPGQTVRLGASGSGGSGIKATYLDPVSTVLPTGVSVIVDDETGVNGDLVLFTNLASGNNRIYELNGVGTSITWTPQPSFGGANDPLDGDSVRIMGGLAFRESLAVFNGTDFRVNDIVRFFDGISADYWELGSIKTSDLLDATTDILFSVAYAGSENINIEYSIIRGATKETGILMITTDGVDVAVTKASTYIGSCGVEFTGAINGADLEISYTADSSGSDGVMKYFLKRWSDAAGGPAGIPSYSGSGGGGGGGTPGGSSTDIQFNNAGSFDGDANFRIDLANTALNLNGLRVGVLSSAVTLNDNQVSPALAIQYPKTWKYAILEYSISRDTDERVGRLLIVNNGTIPSITDDFTETGSTGITFSAAVSGANLNVNYVSSSTSFTGSLKYSIRRWT